MAFAMKGKQGAVNVKKKGLIQGHNYGRRGGYSDIFWGKSRT